MDQDRKYRQRGYMDSDRRPSQGSERPRPSGPRPPLDVTGPRLPRLVQSVAASRCHNCATTLPPGVDFKGACPKCAAALHCCKQCTSFEPSTRFQCLKPVPARIPLKDQANECELFQPRVTVVREGTSSPASAPPPPAASNGSQPMRPAAPPRTPQDARTAFDNLFKK